MSYVRYVQRIVKDKYHEITFDWTGEEDELRDSWKEIPGRAFDLANKELSAIKMADCVVEVDPGFASKGRCIEIGMAIALGRKVIILEPKSDSVFHYMDNVYVMDLRSFRKFLDHY